MSTTIDPPSQENEQVRSIRRQASTARLHDESLLQIPLVRQAFCDLRFRLVERAVDPTWTYEKVIPVNLTGFNPFEGSFYYGRSSCFADWLQDPFTSARRCNEGDLLVREVLFMAHDYLHAWTYQVIDTCFPEEEILTGSITEKRLENLVFCHLITEAVATVGLDYWMLSVKGVNDYCPIGSTVGMLTISYHESRLPEYRRFYPELEVQRPEFLRELATFYCTGDFVGFDADDMRQSPQIFTWLQHELRYGTTQRKLTRLWLAYLSRDGFDLDGKDLEAPLAVDTRFRQAVLEVLSQRLWEKVHAHADRDTGDRQPWRPASQSRRAPLDRAPDFRFTNLGRTDPEDWKGLSRADDQNFRFFLYQYLSAIPFRELPMARLKYLDLLRQQCDVQLVRDLMGDLPRMEPGPDEPRDIFVVN